MIISERARVNNVGILIIPSFIRREQHLESGGRVLRGGFKGNIICVPDGSEIVLVDKLIGNGEIERGAKRLKPSLTREYSSPITLFRKTDIGKKGGIYVGTDNNRRPMDVFRVGEVGLLIALAKDDEAPSPAVREGLPGYPEFDWVREPDASPYALAESYRSWRDRRGLVLVGAINGKNALTPLPESSTDLENAVLVCVMQDLLKSAANQYSLSR